MPNITEMIQGLNGVSSPLDFFGSLMNSWTNWLWGLMIYIVILIVVYTGLMRYGSVDALVATSIIMAIVSSIGVSIGLFPPLLMGMSILWSMVMIIIFAISKR